MRWRRSGYYGAAERRRELGLPFGRESEEWIECSQCVIAGCRDVVLCWFLLRCIMLVLGHGMEVAAKGHNTGRGLLGTFRRHLRACPQLPPHKEISNALRTTGLGLLGACRRRLRAYFLGSLVMDKGFSVPFAADFGSGSEEGYRTGAVVTLKVSLPFMGCLFSRWGCRTGAVQDRLDRPISSASAAQRRRINRGSAAPPGHSAATGGARHPAGHVTSSEPETPSEAAARGGRDTLLAFARMLALALCRLNVAALMQSSSRTGLDNCTGGGPACAPTPQSAAHLSVEYSGAAQPYLRLLAPRVTVRSSAARPPRIAPGCP